MFLNIMSRQKVLIGVAVGTLAASFYWNTYSIKPAVAAGTYSIDSIRGSASGAMCCSH